MAIEKPTVADVKLIIGNFDDILIQSVIDDAALMVEGCVTSFSANRQASIIKWVTAHLFTVLPDGGYLKSEKIGDATDTYAVPQLGDSLAGSPMGQQALLLDPTGCLAKIGRAKASIEKV